jgi:hypothetical protein
MHKKLSLLTLAGVVSLPLVAQNQPPAVPVSPRETVSPSTPAASPAGRHENRDPLLDLPELPNNKVTLIGGTVKSLDEVMNKMVVVPFGSKQSVPVSFDTRTDFFQDGKPISYRTIREGQRVYLDTMLNGTIVFAKKIWIQSSRQPQFSSGDKKQRHPPIWFLAHWSRSVSVLKGSCARSTCLRGPAARLFSRDASPISTCLAG